MQNAAIYNSAASRISSLDLNKCDGIRSEVAEKLAETELNSAVTLNALIGNQSNPGLIRILRADLFTVLERWHDAILEFDEIFSSDTPQALLKYQPKLLAQYALCLAHKGEMIRSRELCSQAISMIDQCIDLDEIIIIHYCGAEIYNIDGAPDKSQYHREACRFSAEAFKNFQIHARSLLLPISEQAHAAIERRKKSPE